MAQYLGIDYGTRRIGLAIGDDALRLASPIEVVDVDGDAIDHVKQVLARAEPYEIDGFVIGLPLNMDGTEGEQVRITRTFGDALARASGKPVHYFDERLSSSTAEELLQPAELTSGKRRSRIDAVAAQVILQGFFNAGG